VDNSADDQDQGMAQTTFTQTNLVSDGSVPAVQTDPSLIDPWGVSFNPTSPFWMKKIVPPHQTNAADLTE